MILTKAMVYRYIYVLEKCLENNGGSGGIEGNASYVRYEYY